jgi:hypothetical protein
MNIDKIISIVKNLREEGSMGMTTGSSGSIAGFGEKSPASGPSAGISPPVGKNKKRPPILARGLMPGARTRWKQNWKKD